MVAGDKSSSSDYCLVSPTLLPQLVEMVMDSYGRDSTGSDRCCILLSFQASSYVQPTLLPAVKHDTLPDWAVVKVVTLLGADALRMSTNIREDFETWLQLSVTAVRATFTAPNSSLRSAQNKKKVQELEGQGDLSSIRNSETGLLGAPICYIT